MAGSKNLVYRRGKPGCVAEVVVQNPCPCRKLVKWNCSCTLRINWQHAYIHEAGADLPGARTGLYWSAMCKLQSQTGLPWRTFSSATATETRGMPTGLPSTLSTSDGRSGLMTV